ncbi:unnamed protein product, partial [Ectocarpus sp. 13 AM-2016]
PSGGAGSEDAKSRGAGSLDRTAPAETNAAFAKPFTRRRTGGHPRGKRAQGPHTGRPPRHGRSGAGARRPRDSQRRGRRRRRGAERRAIDEGRGATAAD